MNWVHWWNYERLHEALRYKSPTEIIDKYNQAQVSELPPRIRSGTKPKTLHTLVGGGTGRVALLGYVVESYYIFLIAAESANRKGSTSSSVGFQHSESVTFAIRLSQWRTAPNAAISSYEVLKCRSK